MSDENVNYGEGFNYDEFFALWGKPRETLDDAWKEKITDLIESERDLVGQHNWDSGAPGAGAGSIDIYRFRDIYVAYSDYGCHGRANAESW